MRESGALRDLPRLHEISVVFIRHGLGDLVRRLGIATLLERAGEVLHRGEATQSERLEPQQRLRLAFEELGPTFVKLGQMLSTRADLLGDDITSDLAALQDRLPPFPGDEARALIEAEFGKPLTELFAAFDETATAAASIAQVHFAKTSDGHEVAVKVLLPGIEAAFARDLDLFLWLARLAQWHDTHRGNAKRPRF